VPDLGFPLSLLQNKFEIFDKKRNCFQEANSTELYHFDLFFVVFVEEDHSDTA
jgi:hypothetical protein